MRLSLIRNIVMIAVVIMYREKDMLAVGRVNQIIL